MDAEKWRCFRYRIVLMFIVQRHKFESEKMHNFPQMHNFFDVSFVFQLPLLVCCCRFFFELSEKKRKNWKCWKRNVISDFIRINKSCKFFWQRKYFFSFFWIFILDIFLLFFGDFFFLFLFVLFSSFPLCVFISSDIQVVSSIKSQMKHKNGLSSALEIIRRVVFLAFIFFLTSCCSFIFTNFRFRDEENCSTQCREKSKWMYERLLQCNKNEMEFHSHWTDSPAQRRRRRLQTTNFSLGIFLAHTFFRSHFFFARAFVRISSAMKSMKPFSFAYAF